MKVGVLEFVFLGLYMLLFMSERSGYCGMR